VSFADVPDIKVDVISVWEDCPTDVGEASLEPTAGVIGNATASAVGIGLTRDLPFTLII
jgi:CO/xanthine dehydrogenase Mo-binding subunit